MAVPFAVLLLSSIVTGVVMYSSIDTKRYVSIQQGDTVLLDRKNGFQYCKVVFTETNDPINQHDVAVYTEPCNHLEVHNKILAIISLRLPGVISTFPILKNKYLISGSSLSLNATTWNTFNSDAGGKVCIRDDNTEHYTKCFELQLGIGNQHAFTTIYYKFTKTSYYSVVLALGSGAHTDIQYNYTLLERSYNHSDYTAKDCNSVTSKGGCVVPLHWDFQTNAQELCILGYTPILPSSQAEYIHLREDLHPRFMNTAVVFLFVITALVIIVIICACALPKTVLVCSSWHRRRNYDSMELG